MILIGCDKSSDYLISGVSRQPRLILGINVYVLTSQVYVTDMCLQDIKGKCNWRVQIVNYQGRPMVVVSVG